ncbi:TetR family transcriptional regulator [Photobacterium jeanii]|uniref:TetR family transcriptional regulator n=1 Tax=Photobacterium jeanii TaxID=858640 RepID=A0A178K4U1_9GAMM|nr:TetR/AcrR family transcriptional regulator [Photobacterium jeanii]OAN11713.1 TetR family transcriptional regulator [Photobacterium jeanii]PST91249.1 TetR/AcrR family transcriptional regulator [Photobacterium jeanii]
MTEKKQGRRSAQAAEETKLLIIKTAAMMFCEQGFERVSLRNISEEAGVSHSLIRHHFGSKEKIWHNISDCLHAYFLSYMYKLQESIPSDLPSNIILYRFITMLLAQQLVHQQPIQLITDGIRQSDELMDYFLDSKGDLEEFVNQLVDTFHRDFPDSEINVWELKWQMMIYANGAVNLKPFLLETWKHETQNYEQCLLNHWELFNQHMAKHLNVTPEEMLHPEKLEDILIELPCEWGCDLNSKTCGES